MAARKKPGHNRPGSKTGFGGLTEIDALDDAQVRKLVLGHWHKLNKVLMGEPGVGPLRRLMVLELAFLARKDILIRLRSALSKANGVEAKAAMERILSGFARGETQVSPFDMVMLGLIGGEPGTVNAARALAVKGKKK